VTEAPTARSVATGPGTDSAADGPGGDRAAGGVSRITRSTLAVVRELLYAFYARRIAASLDPTQIPRHVGVILDGNRRWAKAAGAPSSRGWRAGADKVDEVLGWCDEVGVEVVTLWLLSTDNLGRPEAEVKPLLAIIENLVEQLAASRRWRVHPMGALDLLPDATARVLKDAAAATADVDGIHVNVAVGYGGTRSPTPSDRCCTSTQSRGHRSRTSPTCWTSSTSRSTSTPRANRTPTS
jgi:hypothetical protein